MKKMMKFILWAVLCLSLGVLVMSGEEVGWRNFLGLILCGATILGLDRLGCGKGNDAA